MFVLKANKLYIQDGETLKGVDYCPSKCTILEDESTDYEGSFKVLTVKEVVAKFSITDETPYVFPRTVIIEEIEVEVVEVDEVKVAVKEKKGK